MRFIIRNGAFTIIANSVKTICFRPNLIDLLINNLFSLGSPSFKRALPEFKMRFFLIAFGTLVVLGGIVLLIQNNGDFLIAITAIVFGGMVILKKLTKKN